MAETRIFSGEAENTFRELETQLNDNTLSFTLVAIEGDQKIMVRGHAAYNDGDLESREDEEGNAYFADEYIYRDGEFKLVIAIDLDEGTLAWIDSSGEDDPDGLLPKAGSPVPLKLTEG